MVLFSPVLNSSTFRISMGMSSDILSSDERVFGFVVGIVLDPFLMNEDVSIF